MGEMTRRGFLSALGVGGVATAAAGWGLDPERALWVPGAKTIFVPDAPALYQGAVQDYLGAQFHLGMRDGRDYFFDNDWKLRGLLQGGRHVVLTEAIVREAEAQVGPRGPVRDAIGDGWKAVTSSGQAFGMTQRQIPAKTRLEGGGIWGGGTLTARRPRELSPDETWNRLWRQLKKEA